VFESFLEGKRPKKYQKAEKAPSEDKAFSVNPVLSTSSLKIRKQETEQDRTERQGR
jgi:hypothetical protein